MPVLLVLASLLAAEPSARWPAEGAALVAPELPAARGRKLRVYLDAGHGAPDNHGAQSVVCEDEESFTLRTAEAVARWLEATGRFEVKLSRAGDARPSYPRRLADAERWRADFFVSLHSDARGYAHWWQPAEGQWCVRNDDTPGFAVLWSDAGAESLVSRRSRLAEAIAARMIGAGFLPYDGVDYPGLYDPLPATPGCFVDRHQPGGRIYVLRKPKLPSVIIETHHALDLAEATRWNEPRTLDTFAAALGAALLDQLPSTATTASR